MTTLEKNKIIAGFMGFEDASRFVGGNNVMRKDGAWRFGCRQYKEYRYDELKYHTSWDWLMPVVEKIENMGWKVSIESNCTYINDPVDDMWFETGSQTHNRMGACLDSIIQFIQYHNENKQP